MIFSNWKKKPIVLFDLDGTLIDSQQLVFETFRRVFKELKPDYELSNEELYSFFGPTLEVTFSKYFPEDQVQSIIDRYQVINKSLHKDLLKEVPHAKEMIKRLDDDIRPFLKSFYNGARDFPGFEKYQMTPYDEVRNVDVDNFDKQKPRFCRLMELTI